MELTSVWTVVIACILLTGATIATLAVWNRLPRAVRWPGRVTLLMTSNVAAVLVAAAVLNSTFDFYATWGDLLGHHPRSAAQTVVPALRDSALSADLRAALLAGHGLTTTVLIPGTKSGISARTASVYLPMQYADPRQSTVRYPVIELLDGYPGSPMIWTHAMKIAHTLDDLIATGRIAPTIVVMPTQNVASPRDTECANVVGGPAVDTYLTSDVRSAIIADFRAQASPHNWAVAGYSTGGYCAAIFAARHPSMFAAAASLEGYNRAAHDHTTGSLFGHDTALARQADLVWWVDHRKSQKCPILEFSTRQDPQSFIDDKRLDAAAAAHDWPIWQVQLPWGAHNARTISTEIPLALSWLARFIGPALTPEPAAEGVMPVLASTLVRSRRST